MLKRREKAQEAQNELKKAQDAGDTELIEKFAKRTVRATKEDTEDIIKLLELMGVPVVRAESEAEATCAAWRNDSAPADPPLTAVGPGASRMGTVARVVQPPLLYPCEKV